MEITLAILYLKRDIRIDRAITDHIRQYGDASCYHSVGDTSDHQYTLKPIHYSRMMESIPNNQSVNIYPQPDHKQTLAPLTCSLFSIGIVPLRYKKPAKMSPVLLNTNVKNGEETCN